MALATYSDLKTSLANWLNRTDLTSEISGDFIVLAEKDFNSKLRVRKMIAQSSITIDAETETLPTGFLQVRDFYILQGNTKYSLQYIHQLKWIRLEEVLQLDNLLLIQS